MAVDAINDSKATYRLAVRYYLANLGTTMESQVRSFVYPCILADLGVWRIYLLPPLSRSLVPRCVPRYLSDQSVTTTTGSKPNDYCSP